MNYRIFIKYIYSVLLIFFNSALFSQESFKGNMNIRTGYNYSSTVVYSDNSTLANQDKYWEVIYQSGNTPIELFVGWRSPWELTTGYENAKWLNTGNIVNGRFYYRFMFCVTDSYIDYPVISGDISADNGIVAIRIDGEKIVDLSKSNCVVGNVEEKHGYSEDFHCIQKYSRQLENKLTVGYHILEFEVLDGGGISGFFTDSKISNIDGSVLTSSGNSTSSGCSKKGQIRGVVFNDVDSDGNYDAGTESTIGDFPISIYDASNNTLIATTVTNPSNGAYNFYGLDLSKTYKIVCSNNLNLIPTIPLNLKYDDVSFSANGSTIISNKDFGFRKTYTIAGTVFLDANQNKIKDAGESVLPGYTVQLSQSNSLVASTTSNASGNYTLTGTEINSYTLGVVLQGNDILTTPINGNYSIDPLTGNLAGQDFGIYRMPFNCTECIPSFSPIAKEKYLLSAWVREEFVNGSAPPNYTNAGIKLSFSNGAMVLPTFYAKGPIVDGWQRIESSFTVPDGATNIKIDLVNASATNAAYYDDIRIHPFQSNMKSFVYDPSTQRLTAELDENNYATLYEYDDEGILVRVKKETERGVMTIKESRNNQSKIFKDK